MEIINSIINYKIKNVANFYVFAAKRENWLLFNLALSNSACNNEHRKPNNIKRTLLKTRDVTIVLIKL